MKPFPTVFRVAALATIWLLLATSGAIDGEACAQSSTQGVATETSVAPEDTASSTAMAADTLAAQANARPAENVFDALVQKVQDVSTSYFPQVLGALLILLLGWLLAVFVSWLVRSFMKRSGLDSKLSKWTTGEEGKPRSTLSRAVAKGIFYLVMLFVVVAVFQTLELTILTDPLNLLLSRLFEFVPQLVGAALLLVVAWIIANFARFAVTKVLSGTKFDERFGGDLKGVLPEQATISKTVGDILYWITFLVFLPAILGTLRMEGLIAPVQEMLDKILVAVPNILSAALIFFVGWLVAKVVSSFIVNLLKALGTEKATERISPKGWFGGRSISQLIGTLVYALIIIPVIIAALNALQIQAISAPAIEMLTTVMNAVPSIFAAGVILIVAYVVARLLKDLVSNLLEGIGFNNVPVWLGLSKEPAVGARSPSEITGYIVLVAIVLFALIESLQLLGFTLLAELLTNVISFGGSIVLALIIFGFGLFLANLAHRLVSSGNTDRARLYAQVARYAIIVFVGAMALRQLGVADDIINLAFGILLGAIAIAFAIAFGIGGREVAAKQVEQWLKQFNASAK